MKRRIAAAALCLFAGATVFAQPAETQAGTEGLATAAALEPTLCHASGRADALRCYAIPVVGLQTEQAAELTVLVAPALSDARREPLYLLAGGPGQASSDLVQLLNPLRKINRERDLVFVDRRGAGRSQVFDCGLSDSPPADIERFVELLADCYQADPERPLALTSRQAVEDLEQVRKVLGHEKISLWGGSWGTRTALLYQQWYPQSLQNLVLDGVAPIDSKVFLTAQAAEAALVQLQQDCTADPVCRGFGDWRSALDLILANWDKASAVNFPDPFTGLPSEEPVESWMLANAVRTALYDPSVAAQLPFAIDQAAKGNLLPLSGIVGLFAKLEGSMAMGLTFSVACAEEVSRMQRDEIVADAAGTFLGEAFVQPFVRGCAQWPVPSQEYPVSEARSHPVLLISGSADPITPPLYAEQDLDYLENRQHLIVQGGGHINSARGCIPDLMEEFLNGGGQSLDQACVADIQRPPFMAGMFGPSLRQELRQELQQQIQPRLDPESEATASAEEAQP
ncbi:alpha/beta fold hydrolase [Microbulbifer agarilyticus]|uniref:alpha/beta fold hydrolase n=1 Tax=Microbulbifer agarilyticus TaxID=260552 RepID=UPI001CD6F758|nr:alpha/beta fold hydrolase [Microbulbifer agarilyticus]MCA0894537.1 alpha/beta hydrolase [Microbulbifer agarilyticus]